MMNSECPPIELYTDRPAAREPYVEDYILRFHRGKWSVRKLFVVGILPRWSAFSPDKRWYYMSSVSNGTFLGEVGKPKFKKLDEAIYEAFFSPDSRYLLGRERGTSRPVLVLFTLPSGKKKLLYKAPIEEIVSIWFGWYPDSRHIWFTPYKDPHYRDAPLYRLDVLSGRWNRLSLEEGEAIKREWGVLDIRYAYFPERWSNGYDIVYASDRKTRLLCYSPTYDPSTNRSLSAEERKGRAELVLEWRSGRSQVLVKEGEHSWYYASPRDVSSDGKWALWLASPGDEPPVNALIVMDVAARRWWEVVTTGAEVPGFGTLRGFNEAWFGKE